MAFQAASVLAMVSGAVLSGFAPAFGAPPLGQAPPATSGPSLNALAWIAGQWRSEEGGQLSEETWSAPHGTSMVGMWRLVVGGTPRVLERLSLSVEGNDIVLRLRHFDGALRGSGGIDEKRPDARQPILPSVRLTACDNLA